MFETASYTDGDGDRTRQYQEESKRAGLKKSFVNEEEFLQSLNMTSKCGPFEKLDIPRIAQLTQRSNQFNLRTIRYTDEDINRITSSENHFTLSFKLEDMFGDYGLVSAIIMEKKNEQDLMIDTWIMSCRVLKRGLEQLVLNEIVAIAKANNFKRVIGEYIPTSKNNMVAGHYTGLGFALTTVPNTWTIDVDTYQEKEHFIKKLEPVKN